MNGQSSDKKLHTPITSVPTGGAEVTERLVSPPTPGQTEPIDPGDGVEVLADRIRREAAVEITAPDVVLPDVGAASFDDGVHLETVHGFDDRVRIDDTHRYPWSAIASLLITARDGTQWIGTGWFISPRTLVTAGHCVYITGSSVAARNGWALSIQVMPGRNGTKLPFGSVTATRLWTVRGWAETGDPSVDYGAIVIGTNLGERVGTFGFAAHGDDDLAGRPVNIAGYPGDKPAGTMWYDARAIAQAAPASLHYDIDTAGGQSGAPAYLIDNGQRIGVAIHTYGGPTTNSGTRISPPVFANLQQWKA